MTDENKTGILLTNLGTPGNCTKNAVRDFLREFLSDPLVIDIPPIARWVLVNCMILPMRTRRSLSAYTKIWTTRGSPLYFHTSDLTEKLQINLGDGYAVRFAMRYGRPLLAAVLHEMLQAKFRRIVIIPLYPQYAASTTESSRVLISKTARQTANAPGIFVVPPFFDRPGFADCFAARGTAANESFHANHILFSYHGLPERHIRKSENVKAYCLKPGFSCCETITESNNRCYRAQCIQTTKRIAEKMELNDSKYSVSFQSRLGRLPWIKPYTSEVIPELARQGKRKLLVFCPSFAADCVETLEEIGMRGRESFLRAGGKEFKLVPSLNSGNDWVETLAGIIRHAAAKV